MRKMSFFLFLLVSFDEDLVPTSCFIMVIFLKCQFNLIEREIEETEESLNLKTCFGKRQYARTIFQSIMKIQ